ncbi:MAG: hypothetical protein COA91_07475 [Robiginitomaculum sp.]|nr:MAG: hypothetical protein COA91_07475 [Robiginitomaculum sp.]
MARLGLSYKNPRFLPLQASPRAQEKFIAHYGAAGTELPADEGIVFADTVHSEHQSRPAYG